MNTMREKKWILDKDRPKRAVTIEMPADVVEDLEQVAAGKGMTGHVELTRYYVGKALKEDLSAEHPIATSRDLGGLAVVLHEQLPFLAEQFQVESLGLFGSYVRGAERPDSDLDLLVSFTKPPSLLRFVELENYLSDLLGVKVDLVMRDGLKPRIAECVLSEVVPI